LSSQRPRPAIGEGGHARSRTAETSESTRYVDHHHGQRCWPASAGTSKTSETGRNTHQTLTGTEEKGTRRLWGTPALKGRVGERFTPRTGIRPCAKAGKPPKPLPCRASDRPQAVRTPSTGCTRLHIRPDRGHGQSRVSAPLRSSRSLDTRGVATAKPQLFPPYSTTICVVIYLRAASPWPGTSGHRRVAIRGGMPFFLPPDPSTKNAARAGTAPRTQERPPERADGRAPPRNRATVKPPQPDKAHPRPARPPPQVEIPTPPTSPLTPSKEIRKTVTSLELSHCFQNTSYQSVIGTPYLRQNPTRIASCPPQTSIM
jgi:hypothetical protein